MHIVIGFPSAKGNVSGEELYIGPDRGAALQALKNPSKPGIKRTEIYSHPIANQRYFPEPVTEPVVDPQAIPGTVKGLKARLDELEVDYPATAKKAELTELLQDALADS